MIVVFEGWLYVIVLIDTFANFDSKVSKECFEFWIAWEWMTDTVRRVNERMSGRVNRTRSPLMMVPDQGPGSNASCDCEKHGNKKCKE